VVDGKPFFPIILSYSEQDFGGPLLSEPDYKSERFLRILKGESPDASTDMSLSDFNEGDDADLTLDLGDFDEQEEVSSAPLILTLDDFEEDDSLAPLAETEAVAEAPTTQLEARAYWMLWPPVKYDYKHIPSHSVTGRVALAAPYKVSSSDKSRIIPSSWEDGHYLGTDDRGRDVLARLIYGFRISMIFGLSLAVTGTILGCLLGGIQGFFGGWIDLIGQRLTEIWGSIPRLYILIILSAMLTPSVWLLFGILNLTAWMGMAAYIRAEFLKGRNLEYVKAAKALGVSNFSIMRKHILPNSLTPVITFFPFEVTAGILALVSLDFLNLGVPSPAPSIGELLSQGKTNLQAIWILIPTFVVLTGALTLLTFVGDGIRNAFDPRKAAN
jgi:ABC-type microcin C transport system permease subunit YejE